MAYFDTKIIQVNNKPDTINAVNQLWACFGWNVQNIQITHSQDTRTYSSAWDQIGGNQTQTVETTTINYASITYQRDKSIENYSQIVALEKEYENTLFKIEQLEDENEKSLGLIGIFLLICFWPVGIAYLIYKLTKSGERKAQKEKNRQEIYALQDNLSEIAQKAASLL